MDQSKRAIEEQHSGLHSAQEGKVAANKQDWRDYKEEDQKCVVPAGHAFVVAAVCMRTMTTAIGYKCNADYAYGLYQLEDSHVEEDFPDAIREFGVGGKPEGLQPRSHEVWRDEATEETD